MFKSSPELSKTFNNDVQIISLLLATDKYLINLRKLKNAKAEAIKASLATATANKDRKSTDDQSKATNQKSAKSAKNEKVNDTKLKKISSQAQVTLEDPPKENQKENDEIIDSPPCKYQT